MTDPKTSTPNGNAEDLCITCLMNNAWNFEGCSLCPNYQKKHFAQIYAGEVGNTTYFCVAESPFLNSSAYLENHAGWQFDIENTARNTFEKYEKEVPGIIGHFTYAVRCQSERPSAKEIKACAPNLIEDLKTYSHPDHDICVFAMGATALKALGVQFAKFQDVIGKVFEIKVGDRTAHVFTGLSKKQLATKTGHLEIFDRQVQVFFDLIKKVKNHELENKRSLLAQLSENYRYPKNAREVKELVQEIITYTIQGKQAQFYPIALDTETNTLYPHRDKLQLLVVSVCWDEGRAAAIPLEHSESRIKLDDVREDLARLFNCAKPKLLANAKYDLKVLARKGFSIKNLAWDTMLGEHLISEDKKGFYGLKNITRLRLPDFAAYEDELQEIYAGRKDDDSLIPAPIEEPAHLQLLKKRRVKKVKAPPKEKKSRIEKKLAQDEGFRAVPLHQLLTYAAFDADVTWRIARQQREELTLESNTLRRAREKYQKASAPQAKRIGEVLFDHPNPPLYNMTHRILPTTRVLSEMELHGMAVDQEYTQQLKSEMDEYIRNSKPIFAAMLPVGLEDFNPASTAHVAKVLFSTGYIQPQTEEVICYAGKIEPPRTEKGAISTDAAFLKLLANSHNCTFSKALLEYRAINKARTTFIENISVLSREDGRMHSNFHQHGTATARLSSSEENLQNIPKRIGRAPHVYNIKRLFIPTEPKKIIVNADAKAAEVRVYAAYSKDKALIKALNEGMDPHSFFASTVYNVDNVLQGIPPGQHLEVLQAIGIDKEHAWSYEDFEARDIIKNSSKSYGEALDALRKNIKRVVFGILYGAAPKKISGIVGIPEEQAQAIIRSLFNMFPSITGYIDATKKQVQLLGTVETFLGRRRHLNLKNLPNYLKSRAERQGVNFKIQNTSAEMVLDVLCATHEPIKHEFGGHMLNTVHDSLVFQVDEQYASQMPDFIQDYGVKQVARKFPWLPVPFSWDVEIGYTYGDVMSVPAFFDKNPHAVVEDADEYLDLEIRNELAEEATIKKDAA